MLKNSKSSEISIYEDEVFEHYDQLAWTIVDQLELILCEVLLNYLEDFTSSNMARFPLTGKCFLVAAQPPE